MVLNGGHVAPFIGPSVSGAPPRSKTRIRGLPVFFPRQCAMRNLLYAQLGAARLSFRRCRMIAADGTRGCRRSVFEQLPQFVARRILAPLCAGLTPDRFAGERPDLPGDPARYRAASRESPFRFRDLIHMLVPAVAQEHRVVSPASSRVARPVQPSRPQPGGSTAPSVSTLPNARGPRREDPRDRGCAGLCRTRWHRV